MVIFHGDLNDLAGSNGDEFMEPPKSSSGSSDPENAQPCYWNDPSLNPKWVCLKMLCTPKNPMVNDHYPYFYGNLS